MPYTSPPRYRTNLQRHPFALDEEIFGLLEQANDERLVIQRNAVLLLVMLRHGLMPVPHLAAKMTVTRHGRLGFDDLLEGQLDDILGDLVDQLVRGGRGGGGTGFRFRGGGGGARRRRLSEVVLLHAGGS